MRFIKKFRIFERLATGKNLRMRFSNRLGETFIEVIMALFVVSLGAATATTLIVNSLRSNSFSRDTLVALNLAVEGIEAVRSIRDSNWLKFGYDKKNCWNMRPLAMQGADCEQVNNLLSAGNYAVGIQPLNFEWGIGKAQDENNKLDLADGISAIDDQYSLAFVDIDKSLDSDGNKKPDDDADLYTDSESAALGTISGKSKFYRMVRIIYTDSPEEADKLVAQSVVQWIGNGTTHQVVLNSILANY